GWKEFELEVMRDRRDNVVIVCSIENLDPMGVHTGDSITVAPAMTLTDREYQRMRDAAIAIIREIGVEAGGCNIQFAVNPALGATPADDRLTSTSPDDLRVALRTATPERIFQIKRAFLAGLTVDDIAHASDIDPWFLYQLEELVAAERWFSALATVGRAELKQMKRLGFSDRQLAALRNTTESAIRDQRWSLGIHPAYKTVDTCAGEFPSTT